MAGRRKDKKIMKTKIMAQATGNQCPLFHDIHGDIQSAEPGGCDEGITNCSVSYQSAV